MIKLGIDAPSTSRTAQSVQLLEGDIEIQTLWYMANRTSRRAAVNDHGPVHVRTAMHHGDTLLQLLAEAGIQPNCVTDHSMTEDDARAVVLLGLALHDVGMSVHRDRHELLSVPIALDWLRRKLPPIYAEPQLDELLESLRELGTSEDPQRDAEAAATTGNGRAEARGAGEPLGIGRGRVPTTIA